MRDEARVIRSAEARRMPWRNGGGETVEIAAHPHGADLGGFDWRISLARIERDGPFSTFPGVERAFAVLDGAGVELDVAGAPPARLTRDVEPWTFPGEATCRCRLLGGPVTALNVMAARGAFACAVIRLDPRRGPPMADEAVTVIVCAEGSIATSLGTVERHDVILIPAGASVQVEPGTGPARCLVATLKPVVGAHGP